MTMKTGSSWLQVGFLYLIEKEENLSATKFTPNQPDMGLSPHNFLAVAAIPLLQSQLTGTLSFAMASGLPSLPPGWTQHTAQTGHKYYHHASTKVSTYKRPTDTPQPTPPTPPLAIEQPIKNTALLVPKEQAVPLTEWTSEMSVEPTYSQERPTARIMPNEMWQKLEDRPRKKYPSLISLSCP
jgi:hypothetical protein